MTSSAVRLVYFTNHKGEVIVPEMDLREPEKGSVVLTNGQWGTAWQRHFSDGLWHRSGGGRGQRWENLLTQNNLVLVYDADRREP